MATFKPMLASDAVFEQLCYPLWASPKLDGVRAHVRGGQLLTRTLKLVPNKHVFEALSQAKFEGQDGELIVGMPNAKDVYRQTVSGVMSQDGTPNFSFYVFDNHANPHRSWLERFTTARHLAFRSASMLVLDHYEIHRPEELMKLEEDTLAQGYEGLILRDPAAHYKFGRSTAKEGILLKLKRFQDSEAEVLDVIEEMHNGNAAETNELGRTKRSSAKAGKTGKGRMGALKVRDLKTGVEFELGTGFSNDDKEWWWCWKGKALGRIVKYKHFPIGSKDKPRHPVYLGLRHRQDL